MRTPGTRDDRTLASAIARHLYVLAVDIGARPPGSPANRRATEHVAETLTAAGLDVQREPFTTRWWEPGQGRLQVGGRSLLVDPNPYSPACDVRGRAVMVSELPALEALRNGPAGRVVVLSGALAREQVWPASFPFLSDPAHRAITAALLAARPAAVVAVSDHWQPILEDPDLPLPSTTVRATAAATLGLVDDVEVALRLGGAVYVGTGDNVAGRTTADGRRVVLSAHVDSKATTPGAFDNAGGVAVLLAVAELGLLPRDEPVEVVAFNGEDHVDACGEVAWLAATDLAEVLAIVNLDGAGLRGRASSVAPLACPEPLVERVTTFVSQRPGWELAAPWYESDHAILAMRGIPALAVTSADVHAAMTSIAHTPADTPDVVDVDVLVDVARTVTALLRLVGETLDHRAG